MKILLLSVGKMKESYWRKAADEYVKRLHRYTKLELREVPDEKTPDGAGVLLEEHIRKTEGDRLLKVIKPDDYVAALAIEGKSMDSIGFSRFLEMQNMGGGRLVFVIGGSLGLSRAVLARADESISFSAMTFPHQMMRVILLEQIYRGFRIMRGEPYHK